MGRDFLQLRDRGCRGAWDIFLRAREACLAKACRLEARPDPGFPSGPGRLALCLPSEQSRQADFWRETARQTGGEAFFLLPGGGGARETADILGALSESEATLLIAGGLKAETLREVAAGSSVPVLNAGNGQAAPCQALAEVLLASLRRDAAAGREEPPDTLRLGWVGRADGEDAGLIRSLLDSALCFRHELFIAFPEGHGPDPDHLDFALNAGAKIFLSYDPVPAVEGCHALIAAPWHDAGGGLAPRHPLASDAEVEEAARGIPVFSLVSDLPDTEGAGPASSVGREACLLACQAAVTALLSTPETGA